MYIPSKSKYDPDENGHFGTFSEDSVAFGGRYVPETLMPALLELKEIYEELRQDEEFWKEVFSQDVVDEWDRLIDAFNQAKD